MSAAVLPILHRRVRQFADRPIAFYDLRTRYLCWERGSKQFDQVFPLSIILAGFHLLDGKGRWQVYITGGWDVASVPDKDWYHEPIPHGWEIERYQHDPRIATYHHLVTHQRIDVRTSSIWFDDNGNPWGQLMAYKHVRRHLRAVFDAHASLLATPAQTGCDLLERSLPADREYPVLDDETRALVAAASPQGRFAFYPHADAAPLYCLDGRWMYASCTRDLPGAVLTWDHTNEYIPYAPALYRVSATVPNDWQHLGILPVRDEQDTTLYPNQPGQTITGWVWGPELHIALDHLWSVTIHERIVFAKCDPCQTWIGKLRTMRELVSQSDDFGPLMAAMIRHIVLNAIGSWARQERQIQRIVPLSEGAQVPRNARGRAITPAGIAWWENEPLTADQAVWQHPEWSGLIWSRTRAKLIKAALRLPLSEIVALRADAIYTTSDPGWPDDGNPGTFRLKGVHPAPVALTTYQEFSQAKGAML